MEEKRLEEEKRVEDEAKAQVVLLLLDSMATASVLSVALSPIFDVAANVLSCPQRADGFFSDRPALSFVFVFFIFSATRLFYNTMNNGRR